MRRWLELTPRGDSRDPLWARWHTWQALVLAAWHEGTWLAGAGPEAGERRLQRYGAARRVSVCAGAAFNEPLQILYEYGAFGLVALGLFVAQVAPHLRPGDPWSAAWVVGAVLSLFHWPCRLPMSGSIMLAISAKLVFA